MANKMQLLALALAFEEEEGVREQSITTPTEHQVASSGILGYFYVVVERRSSFHCLVTQQQENPG